MEHPIGCIGNCTKIFLCQRAGCAFRSPEEFQGKMRVAPSRVSTSGLKT